jgi:hypothetical protein
MASYVRSLFYAHSGLAERGTRQKPIKPDFQAEKRVKSVSFLLQGSSKFDSFHGGKP